MTFFFQFSSYLKFMSILQLTENNDNEIVITLKKQSFHTIQQNNKKEVKKKNETMPTKFGITTTEEQT